MPEDKKETLLFNPTATLFFDGVLLFCYDHSKYIAQAGVHVQAEGHDLYIRIDTSPRSEDADIADNKSGLLAMRKFTHREVAARAPFYFYVAERPDIPPPEEGQVALFQEQNRSYRQSFGHVLDLQEERFYPRELEFKSKFLAPINLLNGVFYSAELKRAKRRIVKKESGEDEPIGSVASLIAADLDAVGSYLGMMDKNHRLLFDQPLPLRPDTYYQIQIVNSPDEPRNLNHQHEPAPTANAQQTGSPEQHPDHNQHAGHNHFFEYYETFDLKWGEKQFDVEEEGNIAQAAGDPPCLTPRAGSTESLPEWQSPFATEAE